jgi:hypothetical protein
MANAILSITEVQFTINGISPLLMHNGKLADPLYPFSRVIKRIVARNKGKNKNEDTDELVRRLEWWGGLYLSEVPQVSDEGDVELSPTAHLVLPAHQIESMVREGARKSKNGKAACAGAIVMDDAVFTAKPKVALADMVSDVQFTHRCTVKVGTSRVVRCRPQFRQWSATFKLQIDSSVIDVELIRDAIQIAGRLIGLGDWRPGAPKGGNYGRFELEA